MSPGVPTVSVIIAAYNYAHFLPETLNSVLGQSLASWECIVVDDGSTDNTETIVNSFVQLDPRFRYIHQHNQGLAASRNKGLELARGQYIQFLDADDLLQASKLHHQAEQLRAQPQVSVVYGTSLFFETGNPGMLFYSREGSLRPRRNNPEGAAAVVLRALLNDNFMAVSAPLLRRQVFDNGLRFDTSFSTYEDWKFWLEVCLAGHSFRYTPAPDTATLIRTGHSSMMSATKKMNLGAKKIRSFLMKGKLSPGARIYNFYRMVRLYLKGWYLHLSTVFHAR